MGELLFEFFEVEVLFKAGPKGCKLSFFCLHRFKKVEPRWPGARAETIDSRRLSQVGLERELRP